MLPRPGTMIGAALVFIGVVGAYGSITGNLAPMIAALFYPQLLVKPPNTVDKAKPPKTTKAQQKANPNENVKVRQNAVLGR